MIDDGLRVRFVLSDPRSESICLDTVIKAFVATSDKFKNLEYRNTKHALKEAKTALNEAKVVLAEFTARLRGEITEEVFKAVSKQDKSIKIGNQNKIRETNAERQRLAAMKNKDL